VDAATPLHPGRSRALTRRYALALVVVAGVYVAAGKFGIALPVADGVITPVWAPSGIAIAAAFLLGYRIWPAVFVAAFLVNVTSGADWPVALAIAGGNTLEALTGSYLLRRARVSPALHRVRDVLAFAILGAAIAPTASATVGASAVSLSDVQAGAFSAHWILWWFGDATGVLMVAPLLLVGYAARRNMLPRRRLLEAGGLLVVLVGLAAVIARTGALEHRYIVFPVLLWAAIRFRQLGAAAASLVLGAIGTWGALAGTAGPGISDASERVQSIQVLVAVVALSLLVVGATLAERDRAERAARQAADLLGEAQRLAHVGSWEWVFSTNELSWSNEMYRIWAIDPITFVPSREAFLESVDPRDRPRVASAGEVAEQEGEVAYDFRIRRPDGDERSIQARGTVVFDRAGRAERMIGTAQDVTAATAAAAERERLLTLEREQNERLRELDRLKDNFIASVSHELRTPLTSIVGYLEILADEVGVSFTEQQRRYVEITLRNSARLSRLIGDLLLVAQADAGRLNLDLEPVDPLPVLRECVESLQPWATEARVGLVFEGDGKPCVQADPARLAQLAENLISNAIKFSRPGGRVLVRGSVDGDRFVLEVEDGGCGIPLEEQEHVFERFFRSSLATERAIQGTGLGLSIAKMIADAHGGTLGFASVPEHGTTFRCEMPTEAAVRSRDATAPPLQGRLGDGARLAADRD
jgi:signal transduction histidine kinase/integral membrane sensor domain MASE1